MEGRELVQEDCRSSSPGLGDLPESCIAFILRLTTPRDVARLACVSGLFRAASYSDSVWQTMLPPFYRDILAQAPDAPSTSTCSKKQVYDYMSEPVPLKNGTEEAWLDRPTGGVCRSIGARGLFIVWDDDHRYWRWTTVEGSRFAEVALSIQVCWLEAYGKWKCSLSPGTYILSCRLSFWFGRNDYRGFSDEPVKFSFESTGNEPVHFEKNFTTDFGNEGLPPLRWLHFGKRWMELDVGEFRVERGNSTVELKFSITHIEGGVWKRGLLLDRVVIRPTSVVPKERLRKSR